MLLSNLEIINDIHVLDSYGEMKLPQSISYAITRNLIVLQQEYDCYQKELTKLLNHYSDDIERDENGEMRLRSNGVPIISGSASEQFNADLTSLLSIEVDVALFSVPLESFDYDGEKYDLLSAKDIYVLQNIICR